MPKMKVIFIQNYLIHYRLEFYEELSKYFEIIVVHSGEKIANNSKNFKEIILPMKKFGPFFIQENLLETLKQEKTRKNSWDVRYKVAGNFKVYVLF